MSLRRLAPALLACVLAGCTHKTPPRPPAKAPATQAPAPAAAVAAKGQPAPAAGKAAAPVDVSGLLKKAEEAHRSGNFELGMRLLDQVLQAEPAHRRALGRLALTSQNLAVRLQRPASSPFYLRSAWAIHRLRELKAELNPEERAMAPFILYNEACTLAISGENSRALRGLVEAFEAGFLQAERLDNDHELDTLHRFPEYLALQRNIERRLIEVMLATTRPYPFDFRLLDLDGKAVALADLRGEVTLVAFWGTWCLPARKELPHLADLAKRYHERGLRVVALAFEPEPGEPARQAVRAFVKQHPLDVPCLIGDAATRDRVPRFPGYPTVLFLDRQGKVRLQLTGYQTLLTLETAVNVLPDEVKTKAQDKAQNKAQTAVTH
jgi:thiol-disulfide isomerase/thioredoxin